MVQQIEEMGTLIKDLADYIATFCEDRHINYPNCAHCVILKRANDVLIKSNLMLHDYYHNKK